GAGAEQTVDGDRLAGLAARRRRRLAVEMAQEVDREHGALAGRTVDEDEAAGLLDDAVDGGEAEPGAGADLLGREERLEDAHEILLRDAESGIGDLDEDVVAGRHDLVAR